MKISLAILVGHFALATSLSACAGPDWQAIEQARKNARNKQSIDTPTATAEDKCTQKRLVLPLDHGPRAETTPYLNRQRRAAFEAEVKACKEAAATKQTTQ